MRTIYGQFQGQTAKIQFHQDNDKFYHIIIEIGEVTFHFKDLSSLEQEQILKEIDKNNCDVI